MSDDREFTEAVGDENCDLREKLPDGEWTEPGFRYLAEILHSGKKIEIGGPTDEGYRFSNEAVIHMPEDLQLNIKPGVPNYDSYTGEFRGFVGSDQVDAIAEGQHLPLRNESVGTVMFSELPIDVIPGVIKESARVLKNNGFIMAQAIDEREYRLLVDSGFKLKKSYKQEVLPLSSDVWNVIVQKEAVNEG
jgi:hypothetical protein